MQGFKKERRESLQAIAFYNGEIIDCLLANVQTMKNILRFESIWMVLCWLGV